MRDDAVVLYIEEGQAKPKQAKRGGFITKLLLFQLVVVVVVAVVEDLIESERGMNEPTSLPVGSPLVVFFSPYSFDSHSFIQVHSLELLLLYSFRTPPGATNKKTDHLSNQKKPGRVGDGDDDEHGHDEYRKRRRRSSGEQREEVGWLGDFNDFDRNITRTHTRTRLAHCALLLHQFGRKKGKKMVPVYLEFYSFR